MCASAQCPCSLLSVETFTDRKSRLLGVFSPFSFAAEHNVLHFQSYPLLAQSLAAISHNFIREQQMQAKFKTSQVVHKRHKDSTQIFTSPHASVSEKVPLALYTSVSPQTTVKAHKLFVNYLQKLFTHKSFHQAKITWLQHIVLIFPCSHSATWKSKEILDHPACLPGCHIHQSG